MNHSNLEIVVVDFGSQYTQLIAKKIFKLGYCTQIVNYDIKLSELKKQFPALKAIILSGGPNSVYGENAPKIDKAIWTSDYCLLGVCYGMQLLVHENGGQIDQALNAEYGLMAIRVQNCSKLFTNLQTQQNVYMSHADHIVTLGTNFTSIGQSKYCVAAVKHIHRRFYGVQFHLEVDHTENGEQILENFCCQVANLKKNWNLSFYVEQKIANIKKTVGNQKVLLAISGGVDSTVAAVLIQKAIGNKLLCVFVDHGLLRLNEADDVVKYYQSELNLNVVKIDAKKQFLDALKNVADPEKKRKIVGKLFIDTFQAFCKTKSQYQFLAQGTIYSDVIESSKASQQQKVIKSHHNVGGLPSNLNFKLLEPLNDLFKDQVRAVGLELKISKKIIMRHPFPGPGLSIRIVGVINEEKIRILQKIDALYLNILNKHNYYDLISQAAAFLLPIKAVGVKGDNRAYGYACVLRAIKSNDFMTANVCEISWKILHELSATIINQVPEITRVLYDLTSKPPGTVEWE